MKTYFKLAWRNIWRNKRRTLLTTLSIAFAVFFALAMRSLQVGSFNSILDNVIQSYTGYIQIHKKGYWDQKEDINKTFRVTDTIMNIIQKTGNVTLAIPRLESFALASRGDQTKGVALIGILPEKEDLMTGLSKKITEGKYLEKNDSGILVSQKLAGTLHIKPGDTLAMISQGYQGISAAGKYPVRGILHFASPDLDNRMVYMNLPVCQDFFSCDHRLTSLSLMLKNPDHLEETCTALRNKLDTARFEVMKWDEMLKELMQFIQSKNAGSYFLLGILYLIIGFGIFGTMLMMTNERIREFGVIISIGMQKSKLVKMVSLELVLIGLTGILLGIIIATPFVYHFYINPIRLSGSIAQSWKDFGFEPLVHVAFKARIFLSQAVVVGLLVLISMIYPVRKVLRLNIVNALRSK